MIVIYLYFDLTAYNVIFCFVLFSFLFLVRAEAKKQQKESTKLLVEEVKNKTLSEIHPKLMQLHEKLNEMQAKVQELQAKLDSSARKPHSETFHDSSLALRLIYDNDRDLLLVSTSFIQELKE